MWVMLSSLGGVVARNALVQSKIDKRYGQVVTLVTLSSPFEGSDWADVLKNLNIHMNSHVNILLTTSALRQVTDEQWDRVRRACGERLFHFAAYETKPLRGTTLVVSRESAVWGSDADFASEGDDHLTIAQPTDRSSPLYLEVGKLIRSREAQLITYPHLPDGYRSESFTKQSGEEEDRYVIGPGDVPVRQDIRIPPSVILKVEPGTRLQFHNGAIIECEGILEVGPQPDLPADPKRRRPASTSGQAARGRTGPSSSGVPMSRKRFSPIAHFATARGSASTSQTPNCTPPSCGPRK